MKLDTTRTSLLCAAVPPRTGGFTAHLNIITDARSYTDDMPIHSGKVFSTANEALEAGFQIAKQKIDEGFWPQQ